jgi:TetR/AcrR family transcriptional regulator, mexJK operon transcriptional repressor
LLHYHFSPKSARRPAGVTPSQTHAPNAFKRGPGGRPTRREAERRHANLVASAGRLFLEKGWDGVSVDEISRQSGVAKRFIYARYPDKAALFVGAVERFIDEKMESLHAFEPLSADVEMGLRAFARRLFDLAMRPEALAFLRLFIAEAPRFPELAKLFAANTRHRGLAEISRVLAHYAERGAIELGESNVTAEQFFILVVGAPQRLALLGVSEEPPDEERRLNAAVSLFLDGCRKR